MNINREVITIIYYDETDNNRAYKIVELNGKKVEVDEHCVDMVLFLNEIGLQTSMSCQGHEKPIYRIWFDVEDEVMLEFIKKTGAWTEFGIRPSNPERTRFEVYEYVRGLQGWVYKRYYYRAGIYTEVWVYQAEGEDNTDAIKQSKKDLATMKAIYKGLDFDRIKKEQCEIANFRASRLNYKYRNGGETNE